MGAVLIENYLANRRQITRLDNLVSEEGAVHNGVMQGLILDPTLFLAYINDLKNCNLTGGINLYADDTAIYTSNIDIQTAAS